MDNKRRNNRVQGGWAKQGPSRSNKPMLEGQSNAGKNFAFKETSEPQAIRQKPVNKVLNKNIELDETLSTTENGKSIILYYPNFLQTFDADKAYSELLLLKWEQVTGINRGKEFLMPREMIWYGPMPYLFAGAELTNNTDIPPIVQEINELICKIINKATPFNSVLLNHYRDNHDSVDWHSDDENLFGKWPTIASVSLGETRNFELRQKPILPDRNYEYSQHVEIPLVHGSLLIMEGAVQLDWQHRLRKEFHTKGHRINLTYRDCV